MFYLYHSLIVTNLKSEKKFIHIIHLVTKLFLQLINYIPLKYYRTIIGVKKEA